MTKRTPKESLALTRAAAIPLYIKSLELGLDQPGEKTGALTMAAMASLAADVREAPTEEKWDIFEKLVRAMRQDFEEHIELEYVFTSSIKDLV